VIFKSVYVELQMRISDVETQEIVLALFSALPFDAFEEGEVFLNAYIKNEDLSDAVLVEIDTVLKDRNIQYVFNETDNRNWNAEWEQHFQPVEIHPNICRIYAPFHEIKSGFKNQIIIQPKMAFGTGHHPTTKLMIRAMVEYNFVDKKVLDFGTGTGVLAIFAVKRGAAGVTGTDIDQNSIDNANENAALNHMSNISWHRGKLESLNFEQDAFDIVLANIHLSVLLTYAEELFRLTKPMGLIFLSGILSKDQNELLTKYNEVGFELDQIMEENGWICAAMRRFIR
jgi:ribosomal protein L11 methyltransferase